MPGMEDTALTAIVMWVTANPLEALGVMVGIAAMAGVFAIRPHEHEQVTQHHPRC